MRPALLVLAALVSGPEFPSRVERGVQRNADALCRMAEGMMGPDAESGIMVRVGDRVFGCRDGKAEPGAEQ